jgi:hypothetical protein
MQSPVGRHQGDDGDWDEVSEAMCSFSFWFGFTGADGYAPQVILLVVVGEEEHLDGQYETVSRQGPETFIYCCTCPSPQAFCS